MLDKMWKFGKRYFTATLAGTLMLSMSSVNETYAETKGTYQLETQMEKKNQPEGTYLKRESCFSAGIGTYMEQSLLPEIEKSREQCLVSAGLSEQMYRSLSGEKNSLYEEYRLLESEVENGTENTKEAMSENVLTGSAKEVMDQKEENEAIEAVDQKKENKAAEETGSKAGKAEAVDKKEENKETEETGSKAKKAEAVDQKEENKAEEKAETNTEKSSRDDAKQPETATKEAIVQINGFEQLGMPDVEDYLNIRMEPSEEAEIAGHLYKGSGCDILEEDGEWTKIVSGEVEGYVKTEFLMTGSQASKEAEEYAKDVAVVETDGLNVRKKASGKSKVLSQVDEGEKVTCLSVQDGWAEIEIDDKKGYVSTDYVTVEKTLEKAVTAEEIKYGTGISATRAKLVEKACSYIGNPYVWGGTSLTNGVDCSGFTMQIYAEYGIYLPHYSGAQAECGTPISVDELQLGDLIFYANSSGTINHVSIYMGDGMVVHAKNSNAGITTTDMYYRTPVKMISLLG